VSGHSQGAPNGTPPSSGNRRGLASGGRRVEEPGLRIEDWGAAQPGACLLPRTVRSVPNHPALPFSWKRHECCLNPRPSTLLTLLESCLPRQYHPLTAAHRPGSRM